MKWSQACLALVMLASCSSPYAVESNVREPGEPASINRRLSEEQQAALVDAMADAQTPRQREAARELQRAGEAGRWSDVPEVARKAASDCEVGVLREDRVDGGLRYRLRTIEDDSGTLTVMGDAARGVISVQASIGEFGQRKDWSERLERAFFRRLREWASVPRSPEDLPVADQGAGR